MVTSELIPQMLLVGGNSGKRGVVSVASDLPSSVLLSSNSALCRRPFVRFCDLGRFRNSDAEYEIFV